MTLCAYLIALKVLPNQLHLCCGGNETYISIPLEASNVQVSNLAKVQRRLVLNPAADIRPRYQIRSVVQPANFVARINFACNTVQLVESRF